MALNEKYSYKSWKRQSFTGKDPAEFNDSEIVGAGFSQNEPFTDVFPALISKVKFINCNLDNCNIPAGATVEGGTNKHFKEQADGELWIVDAALKPTVPLKPHRFDKWGVSKDPKDITATTAEERLNKPVTMFKEHLQDNALKDLTMDTDKLIQILKDEGKL